MSDKVTFNEERFSQSDEISREATRKLYKKIKPKWILEDNPNRYGVDFIVRDSSGKIIAYIECELSNTGFLEGSFKYPEIRLVSRKNHFLRGLDANERTVLSHPIYICTIDKELKGAVIYSTNDMMFYGRLEEGCRNYIPNQGYVSEDMWCLNINYCKTFDLVQTVRT